MLVEFTLSVNGRQIYINPANVNYVCGHKDSDATSEIEMAGYFEDQGFTVIGTPAEVAAKLNGAEVRNA